MRTIRYFEKAEMSTTSLLINDIKNKLLITVCITYIALGTLGNVLNIILCTRRALWTLSPSIPLLLFASIANLITIYPYLVLRACIGFSLTLVYTSSILCKMHIYLYYISVCISSWLMVGCCADRFFASSRNVKIRSYSNMKIIRRMITIVVVIIPCVYVQTLYCYEINQFTKPSPCYQQNSACGAMDIVNYFVFQSVGPPVFMLIFIIGTLMHIRKTRQLKPETTGDNNNNNNNRKNNLVNTRLLFTQVAVYFLCSIPLFAMKIYALIPQSIVSRSDVRLSIESFLLNVSLWFSIVDKIFSFYIYTLSSKYFRHELVKLFKRTIQNYF